MFTRGDMRRRVAIKIHRRVCECWYARWHAHRLLKTLSDGRAGSKCAGTYLRHFIQNGPLSCRNYNCYRHYRMRYAHDAFGVDAEIPPRCLSRRSRFDRKRQSDRKNIRLPGNVGKNTAAGIERMREGGRAGSGRALSAGDRRLREIPYTSEIPP